MGLGLAVDAPLPLAAPGQSVNLTLNLVAPTQPGTHKSQWALESPTGALFGPLVNAVILVDASPAECKFVTDVTLPDGANVAKGEVVRKTWRWRNVGNCNLAGHALCFVGEDDSSTLGADVRS